MKFYTGAYTEIPSDTMFFVTCTVVDWVDVFTREKYRHIIIDSLDYCRKKKGLMIHAWVLMTNHIHLIVSHEYGKDRLAKVIADFKKFTSKAIIRCIKENYDEESRREWILVHFISHSDGNKIHFWQNGYYPYEITNIKHLRQKIDYLHENPVRAGFVRHPGDFKYSSYSNYCGEQSEIEIDIVDLGLTNPSQYRRW